MTADAGCVEEEQLSSGVRSLGISIGCEQQERYLRYLDLLYRWNPSAGLTTVKREEAVRLHLLDSLAALWAVDAGPCIDFGTGAGLPGMILALARPDLEFVLVESNRRKCSFLFEVRRELSIPNARILEADVASLNPGVLYPTVISRAFREPSEFLRLGRRLMASDGTIVAMMAEATDEELGQLATAAGLKLEARRKLTLPGGSEQRTVARFRP